MPPVTRYPVPARTHRTQEEIRRSRFVTTLARAASAEEAAATVRQVSEEFADANHNCWAFVAGPPGTTDRIGMSDAGEPHGTAGRPMLSVLLHSGIGEIVAVVTRYFGGTKLGTGGLVRAYSGCVQHALESLPVGERVDRVAICVAIDYAHVSGVQQLFSAFEVEVVSQNYGTDARFDLRLPDGRIEAFERAVLDATRGQARFAKSTSPA